jgi:hypothetical protein
MKLSYLFESRLEANYYADLLGRGIRELLDKYGYVSVVDVYDILYMYLPISKQEYGAKFTDILRGWTEYDDVKMRVIRERSLGCGEYGLELSDPKLIGS